MLQVPVWLQIIERIALAIAAIATVVAVLLAVGALRESNATTRALDDSLALARAEHEKRQRERAALVLPRIDLLQARLNGNLRDGLAYEEVHPNLDSVDRHILEIEQDIRFADELSERASRIDPQVAVYAELVWRRIKGIRLALGHAQRNAPQDRERLGAELVQRRDGEWTGHRSRIMQLAAEAAELLRRMEGCFPPDATTIDGMSRKDFLAKANSEVESPAKERASVMLKELSEKQFIKTEF